jgi:peptide/nickel transport system substrate-binding protein
MKKVSRREMIKIFGLGTAGVVITACTTPAAPTTVGAVATSAPNTAAQPAAAAAKEAPALAALVKSGKLPPLEERLPSNPLVVKPHESVGKYGGQWRQNVPIGNKTHAFAAIGSYGGRSLVVHSEDLSGAIVPNIAESWEVSPDAKIITFKLRKGLKWSDGQPFTTKDVEFWWKAYSTNTTLQPDQTDNKGVTFKVIDDFSFSLTYSDPVPLQMEDFAQMNWQCRFMPEHYLKQFHPDYTAADTVSKQAKDAGFDTWDKYFGDRNDYQNNPDLPTMGPWMLVTKGAGATQLVLDRNPYFWAVDPNGNQLPYIDQCVVNIVESTDIVNMKAVSGEFEVQMAAVMENFGNYPLYAKNAAAGNYKVYTSDFDEDNCMNIHLNQAAKEPAKRAIMQKVEFRQAMALAINRPEIISTLFTIGNVVSTPRNWAPIKASPFYDEELSTEYTKFDQDAANKLLDTLGMDKRGADGKRQLPDGSEFTIVIDVPTFDKSWIDVGTMIAKNWADVGINASARSVDPALWGQRIQANDFDCSIHTGGDGFQVLSKNSVNDYTGYRSISWCTYFSSGYWIWRNSGGTSGVEPVDAVKQLWDLGTKVVIEPDKDKQIALVKQIIQIHKDNLFILGIGTRLPASYLVKNNVKNVPPLGVDWTWGCSGAGRPEQYYIEG